MSRLRSVSTWQRVRVGACSLLAATLAAGLTAPAHAGEDPADKKRTVDGQISTSEDQIRDTSTQLTKTYDALKRTRAQLPSARKAASDARSAETIARGAYDEAVTKVQVAEANERKAKRAMTRTNKTIATKRSAVGAYAGELYQDQGMSSLALISGADSPSEVVDRIVASETVTGLQSDALKDLSTTRADLVSQQDHLGALKRTTQQARDRAEDALGAAEDARQKADDAQNTLEGLESEQSKRAADLRRERGAEIKRLDGLQAESDRLGDVLAERARKARIREEKIRAAQAADARRRAKAAAANKNKVKPAPPSSPAPRSNPAPAPRGNPAPAPPASPAQRAPSGGGVLAPPVAAPPGSPFGMRYHPILHYWRMHTGQDYGAACGTPVYAAASGRIVSAGVAGGYGNQLVVDHGVKRGTSLTTSYNHLSSFVVTSGSVSRGQVIGRVGTTGLSTGCHLHFETRENGVPVNPMNWL